MNPRLVFRPDARLEFIEAIARYEGECPGLGREFAREVIRALKRARQQPEVFRRVRGRARKIRLRRFKAYSIYFAAKGEITAVLSVFHGARNPAELRQRLR